MQNRAIRWKIIQKHKYFFVSYQINSGYNPLPYRKKSLSLQQLTQHKTYDSSKKIPRRRAEL